MADSTTGVLLMSFGAAATPQDVPAYLERVRRAKPPPELVAEFQRRYRLAGGSPLVRNTWAQALALESLLESQDHIDSSSRLPHSSSRRKPGSNEATQKERFTVSIGMRHTPPFIEEGFGQLAAKGVSQVVGLILSPQYSPHIMGGYHRALEQAREAVVPHLTVPLLPVRVAGAWHTLPAFIDALARRLSDALDECPAAERDKVAVLMTAHSLPKAVADQEPDYLQQLRQTADAVAQRVGSSPTSLAVRLPKRRPHPPGMVAPRHQGTVPHPPTSGTPASVGRPRTISLRPPGSPLRHRRRSKRASRRVVH